MFKKTIFLLAIIVVSGLSAIMSDRYLFPRLAATKLFSKYDFLKKSAEDVTVINKTEQIYVKEDSSVAKLMSPVVSSVVNIVSFPNPEAKTSSSQMLSTVLTAAKNGTGEIVTSDGIIMTYFSAINYEKPSPASNSEIPAYQYKIMTADGNVYDAELLAVDSWSNLAFLKINASNLPVVSFGEAGDYQAGEKVITIGNNYPFYQNHFNAGILNGYDPAYNIAGQALNVPEKLEGVFRMDINPVQSPVGGVLVDYSGRIMGIVGQTQKDGQIEYFAIPSDKIKMALDKVIKKETDKNAALGAYYIPITKTLTLTNNLGFDQGALIYSPSGQQGLAVISGSPAAAAGLKIGDIITKVGEKDITQDNNLSTILYGYKKGDKIKLTVSRDGKEMEVEVQL